MDGEETVAVGVTSAVPLTRSNSGARCSAAGEEISLSSIINIERDLHSIFKHQQLSPSASVQFDYVHRPPAPVHSHPVSPFLLQQAFVLAGQLRVKEKGPWLRSQLQSQGHHCGLRHYLVYLLPLYQLEPLSISAEKTFEAGVGVGVDVVLGKDGEPCVLDNGIPNGAEFEVMDALCEKFLSVDPGQKAGNVA